MSTVQPATLNSNRFSNPLQKRANKSPRSSIISSTTCTEELPEDPTTFPPVVNKGLKDSGNLNQPDLGTSEMGFELLRRHYQEMNVDFKAMEGHTGEVVHKAEVEKLLLELQDGKEANDAMRKQIEAYQEAIKAKRLALDALSSRLEEISLENERATASLRSCREDQKTTEACSTMGTSGLEGEDDFGKHNQVVDHFLSRLESTVLRLQKCNHDNRPRDL